jgi:cell filamentation protein
MSTARLGELRLQPIKGNFDLEHLKRIHQYIFQDVYPFAGQIRNEDIFKGTTRFAHWRYIEDSFATEYRNLQKENFLRETSKEFFAKRAAHYMAEINMLHPFREGNGRAQREYIRCLAAEAGFELDWSAVDHQKILIATIKSVMNPSDLGEIIQKCIR